MVTSSGTCVGSSAPAPAELLVTFSAPSSNRVGHTSGHGRPGGPGPAAAFERAVPSRLRLFERASSRSFNASAASGLFLRRRAFLLLPEPESGLLSPSRCVGSLREVLYSGVFRPPERAAAAPVPFLRGRPHAEPTIHCCRAIDARSVRPMLGSLECTGLLRRPPSLSAVHAGLRCFLLAVM